DAARAPAPAPEDLDDGAPAPRPRDTAASRIAMVDRTRIADRALRDIARSGTSAATVSAQ
ncbi:MAG: hypothetical protein ACKOUM_03925, partial [Sphingopyxis sp.]